jgi:TolB protein
LQSTGEIAVWKVNLATGKETRMTYPLAGNADLSASWSFDGERIVFVRRQRGRSSLWLLAAEGGEPHELRFDQYNSLDPAWSADSRRIVFSSDRAGSVNLWEIEIDSQRLRQLTAGSGSDVEPAIAHDGRLAYSQFSHQVDLYCLQIDRAKEERLTFSTRDNFHARFSPDGKKIVYQSNRTGNDEIWLLDVETKAERPLTNHPGIDGAPDWSPDGREIVFLSNREDGFHLWVMNAEGESLRRLTKQPIPGTVEGYQTVTLRCSPDGKVIGYLAPGDQGSVALASACFAGRVAPTFGRAGANDSRRGFVACAQWRIFTGWEKDRLFP